MHLRRRGHPPQFLADLPRLVNMHRDDSQVARDLARLLTAQWASRIWSRDRVSLFPEFHRSVRSYDIRSSLLPSTQGNNTLVLNAHLS